jgi:hypothetical protein
MWGPCKMKNKKRKIDQDEVYITFALHPIRKQVFLLHLTGSEMSTFAVVRSQQE